MDDLLTVKQVAIILKVHQLTIRRYINEGKLKAIRIAGNIRITHKDLQDFSENYIPNSTSKKNPGQSISTSPFSANDPLFRIKGRGVSIDKF
jgi:excisionase family DNA binding protein